MLPLNISPPLKKRLIQGSSICKAALHFTAMCYTNTRTHTRHTRLTITLPVLQHAKIAHGFFRRSLPRSTFRWRSRNFVRLVCGGVVSRKSPAGGADARGG